MDMQSILRRGLSALRRRYLFPVLLSPIVFVVVCAVIYNLPAKYQSTASILVESQQIPSDLAKSTITANASERVQVIQQRIMTRDNLLTVARKHNLYVGQDLSPTDVVERMRAASKIDQVSVGAGRRGGAAQTIAFTISFEYENAMTASRVTNDFVSLILEQNIEARTRRASETSRFFEQQVAAIQKELTSVEARIVDFKTANATVLQETVAQRQIFLSQLASDEAAVTLRIRELEEKRRQVDQERPTTTASSGGGPNLQQLNVQLAQMRNNFHELHPNVRAVKAQIQAIESLQAELAQLPGLVERRSGIQARMAAVQDSIKKTPQVETALASLTRTHQDLLQQLGQARTKLSEAEIGERLEADRQAERFEVIEQATVPTAPKGPPQIALFLGGGLGSLVLGFGAIAAAEFLDARIRTENDIVRRLQVRPLASVPYIQTAQERSQRRRRLVLRSGLILVLGAAALLAVHVLYSPLPRLVERVIRALPL